MSQRKHFLEIITPLDNSELQLRGFEGEEELSRPFAFNADFIFKKGELPRKELRTALIGKNVTLRIELADQSPKYFNGFVRRILADYGESFGTVYRLKIVPFLWFLTQTTDCRIFQQKTVPEIVKQVIDDVGYGDWIDLSGLKSKYEPRDYCVQYRETDFDFVSRLLEEEGIFYFFKHDRGEHKMVLADSTSGYFKLPENEVRFPLTASPSGAFEDRLLDWDTTFEFAPGKWSQTDYNFETPSTSLMTNQTTTADLAEVKNFEIYDYPGGYLKKKDGEALTKLRMEMQEASYHLIEGKSTCRTFSPGGKFKIVDVHPIREEVGKTFVVTRIKHQSVDPSIGKDVSQHEYINCFTCMPDSTVFRPALTTQRPIIPGVQTAVVVGPKGEEIYTDKYGRVKVQFHWDREGKQDENSSCWIRVSHNVAGNKWGFMALPRIGQEVVVMFLEGDPDQPLIVGGVYNAEQMPHYNPEQHSAKSYIKTNSTKGGVGFNEICLDDKKGSERIYIHAQKDQDIVVEHDQRTHVCNDRSMRVGSRKDGKTHGGNETVLLEKNRVHAVKGDDMLHVHGNKQITIGGGENPSGGNLLAVVEKQIAIGIGGQGLSITNEGSEVKSVGQSSATAIASDQIETIGRNRDVTVGMEYATAVGQAYTLDAGQSIAMNAGMAFAVEAGMDVHIKSGLNLVIEAGASITLKVGGNFVCINPAGVQIQGTLVTINTGGAPGAGGGCRVKKPEKASSNGKPTLEKLDEPAKAHEEKTGYKSTRF